MLVTMHRKFETFFFVTRKKHIDCKLVHIFHWYSAPYLKNCKVNKKNPSSLWQYYT